MTEQPLEVGLFFDDGLGGWASEGEGAVAGEGFTGLGGADGGVERGDFRRWKRAILVRGGGAIFHGGERARGHEHCLAGVGRSRGKVAVRVELQVNLANRDHVLVIERCAGVDAFGVDVGSVAAFEVDDDPAVAFKRGFEPAMMARKERVFEPEVAIEAASDGDRSGERPALNFRVVCDDGQVCRPPLPGRSSADHGRIVPQGWGA